MALFHKSTPKNPSAYQMEVLALKRKKQEKHDKSHVRHPLKSIKSGYHKVHDKASVYWTQGQQLGQAQLHNHPTTYVYSQQDVKKYIRDKMPRKKKIIYGTIIGAILVITFLGILD